MNKSILDFEVRKRFMEAIKGGRYIVTISPADTTKNRNDHYAVFNNYPTEDIIPSLEQTNRLVFNQLPEASNPMNHEPETEYVNCPNPEEPILRNSAKPKKNNPKTEAKSR